MSCTHISLFLHFSISQTPPPLCHMYHMFSFSHFSHSITCMVTALHRRSHYHKRRHSLFSAVLACLTTMHFVIGSLISSQPHSYGHSVTRTVTASHRRSHYHKHGRSLFSVVLACLTITHFGLHMESSSLAN